MNRDAFIYPPVQLQFNPSVMPAWQALSAGMAKPGPVKIERINAPEPLDSSGKTQHEHDVSLDAASERRLALAVKLVKRDLRKQREAAKLHRSRRSRSRSRERRLDRNRKGIKLSRTHIQKDSLHAKKRIKSPVSANQPQRKAPLVEANRANRNKPAAQPLYVQPQCVVATRKLPSTGVVPPRTSKATLDNKCEACNDRIQRVVVKEKLIQAHTNTGTQTERHVTASSGWETRAVQTAAPVTAHRPRDLQTAAPVTAHRPRDLQTAASVTAHRPRDRRGASKPAKPHAASRGRTAKRPNLYPPAIPTRILDHTVSSLQKLAPQTETAAPDPRPAWRPGVAVTEPWAAAPTSPHRGASGERLCQRASSNERAAPRTLSNERSAWRSSSNERATHRQLSNERAAHRPLSNERAGHRPLCNERPPWRSGSGVLRSSSSDSASRLPARPSPRASRACQQMASEAAKQVRFDRTAARQTPSPGRGPHDSSTISDESESTSYSDVGGRYRPRSAPPFLEKMLADIEDMERERAEIRRRWNTITYEDEGMTSAAVTSEPVIIQGRGAFDEDGGAKAPSPVTVYSPDDNYHKLDMAPERKINDPPQALEKKRLQPNQRNRFSGKMPLYISGEVMKSINDYRLEYDQYLRTGLEKTAAFTPWEVNDQLCEEIIKDVIDEIADELEVINAEIVQSLYKHELINRSGSTSPEKENVCRVVSPFTRDTTVPSERNISEQFTGVEAPTHLKSVPAAASPPEDRPGDVSPDVSERPRPHDADRPASPRPDAASPQAHRHADDVSPRRGETDDVSSRSTTADTNTESDRSSAQRSPAAGSDVIADVTPRVSVSDLSTDRAEADDEDSPDRRWEDVLGSPPLASPAAAPHVTSSPPVTSPVRVSPVNSEDISDF